MTEYQVSIVIPCLNEERVISDVILSCKAGLNKNNLKGQILIVDSGTDNSAKIAEKLSAEVLKVPKKGLGSAYRDSILYIKSEYVVMGDADGTYDYREIGKFIKKLDEGYDFVMGTRLKGWIQKGAMPKLHRYLGTPVVTWILNRLFHLKFSDVNCGLRALTKKALIQIDLKSRAWEYASEMVVKAGLLKLKTAEIPIHFYKDKKGRLSHLKRGGWFTPWYAGWINLKIMLLYAPNFVFFVPGLTAFVSGVIITVISTLGLISSFQYHYALLGLVLTMVGYIMIQLGILSKVFSDLNKYYDDALTKFIKKKLNYNSGMTLGFVLFFLGLTFNIILLTQWVVSDFKLQRISIYGTTGLTLMVIGFQTIAFTFIYEVFRLAKK